MMELIAMTLMVSILSSIVSEALSYWMLYRKEDYKYLRGRIEFMENEAKKITLTSGKKSEKKAKMFKSQLNTRKQEMNKMKMKSTVFTSLLFMGTMYYMKRAFEGFVVARLPFEPFSIVSSLSHRGLDGDDMNDCSFIFLYILCSMGIRANVKRIMGFSPKVLSTKPLFEIPDEAELNRRTSSLLGGQ